MATFYLLVALCLIGGTSAQFPFSSIFYFYDGTEILSSQDGGTPVGTGLTGDDIVHVCYSGFLLELVFSTADGIVYVGDSAESRILMRAGGDGRIISTTCCCGVVAVSYRLDENTVEVAFIRLTQPHVINKHTIFSPQDVYLECKQSDQNDTSVMALSSKAVWLLTSDLPEFLHAFNFTDDAFLGSIGIRDFTFFFAGDVTENAEILVVPQTLNVIISLSWDGSTDTVAAVFRTYAGRIWAISSESSDELTVVGQLLTSTTTARVITFDATEFVETNFNLAVDSGIDYVLPEGSTFSLLDVSFCGQRCLDSPCEYASCSCQGICGFCFDNSETCICENSFVDQCCYSEFEEECRVCVSPDDNSVFVLNPVAQRRRGPDIHIVGLSRPPATEIEFFRYVDAGRYRAPNLPQNMQGAEMFVSHADGDYNYRRIRFPLQSRGRGRRFGVFGVYFDSMMPTVIPAIATENSRFLNKLFSYVAEAGSTMDICVQMLTPLDRFAPSVRWRFQSVIDSTVIESTSDLCAAGTDRLTCRITDITRGGHEGVYEAYRLRRQLRNWHPYIFLHVRECPFGTYGLDCNLTCGMCGNGMCEETCGDCVCYPGWKGENCDEACEDGDTVGTDCNVKCSELFPDITDCRGVVVFNRGRTPASCRSGLYPPYCMIDCPDDTWGANCQQNCPTPGTTCDPRTGFEP